MRRRCKKDYDLFVLQTLQSPLGIYTSTFSIDNNKNVTSSKITISTTLTKKKDSGITSRVVKLNELDNMMLPFIINNERVTPGKETETFKSFINSFRAAYELRETEITK